jgi:Asp-tRNA(Asn)/Glu-tRNA(Gln) amidotransferase C subunit
VPEPPIDSAAMPDFDIAYVAHLARLELSDAEKAKLSAQLAGILNSGSADLKH